VLLATFPAHAQQGLLETYELALQNDPAIREAEANFLATSEVKARARSSLLPSLTLGGSTSDNTSKNPDPPLDFFTGEPSTIFSSTESESESTGFNFGVSQTLFDWSAFLALKRADKTIAQAETVLATARQDLLFRVASAYFSVLGAEDGLAAELAARDAIEQQLYETQRRFDVGLIAVTDVQEAQAGFDRAVASVIAAERVVASSREALREIIDLYSEQLRSPIAELPLLTPDPNDVEAWVEIAQGQNLALIASRIAVDMADDDISISRSSRFPTLRLSASSSESEFTSTQTTNLFAGGAIVTDPTSSQREGSGVSLSLSVPIYNGGSNRSAIRQSVFRRRAATEALERTTRQVIRMTRDAYLAVISDISRVQALAQAVESSRAALRATEAGFDVGQRTSADIVRAQNAVTLSETAYSVARYDYLIDVLRLKQATGDLSVADLADIDAWLE
jgi:outer membrane protein